MRYRPEHKLETHRKIVKDASRRVRAKGLNGAAVSAVMKDAGLTHGGFYKHFRSKDDLLLESLREGFREIEDSLAHAAEQSPPGAAWKAIVKTYLSLDLCENPERGCSPGGAFAGTSAGRQKNEAADCGGAGELQEPNGAVHARSANRGQRTRFLCDFFRDDRGSCNCSTAAGSHDARESAGEHKRFPLAQLLTFATRVVAWINQSIAARLTGHSKSKCSRTPNADNRQIPHPGDPLGSRPIAHPDAQECLVHIARGQRPDRGLDSPFSSGV